MAVKMTPYKLKKATIKKIVQGFRTGLPKCKIAASVGVNRKTLQNWLRDQKDPPSLVRKLQREVAQAEEACIQERLGLIKQAAQGGAEYKEIRVTKNGKSRINRQLSSDWRAAAWFLDHRYPKSFASRHIEDDDTSDALMVVVMTPNGHTEEMFAEYLDHPFNDEPQDMFAVHGAPVAMRKAPYKLTEAKIETIAQGVRKGLPWSVIATSVGVNRKTLRNWLKDQENPHSLVRKLQQEVGQASAAIIQEHLDVIKQAAQGGAEYKGIKVTRNGNILRIIRQTPPDWKAAAWLLERRYPKSFALRHIEVDDDFTGDNPLIVEMTDYDEPPNLFDEHLDAPFDGKTQDLFDEHLDVPFDSKTQDLFDEHLDAPFNGAPAAARKTPHKLTETKIETIVQGVRKGLPESVIAASVGVNRETLRNWLRDQEDPHLLVRKLQQEVGQAEAAYIQELLDLINRAARGDAEYREIRATKTGKFLLIIRQLPPDWRAAAWFLERRYPESYSERHIEVEDDNDDFTGDAPLVVGMTPDGETVDLFAAYRDHPFCQDGQEGAESSR